MSNSLPYRFHVLVPLWGPAYIAGARKFLFSSILAPGNLSRDIPINLHIIGKQSEEALVTGCPEWKPISERCQAQFDGLDDKIFEEMSYFAMSHCYDHALSKYESPESIFIFLTGDIVLAENTFSFLKELVDQGYRAATVPGPRVREESVEHLRRPDGVLVATGRDLMRAMWEKPLALTEGYQVMANGRNKCPMHYYWRVGQYSTLARNTMMHPLMAWPDNTATRVVCPPIGGNAASAALDQGYMRHAIARAESIYVGYDSDKLAVVSISDDKHFSNDIMIEEGYTLEQEKGIFSAFCNDYHFWYGAHDLFLKGEELEPGAWTEAQAKAAANIKMRMDYAAGIMPAELTQPAAPPAARRVRSRMVAVRNVLGRIPFLKLLYAKSLRFLIPALGRLETGLQDVSLQTNNLAASVSQLSAGQGHLAQGHNDLAGGQNNAAIAIERLKGQIDDLSRQVAKIEATTRSNFERIVALESGIQSMPRIGRATSGFVSRFEAMEAGVQALSHDLGAHFGRLDTAAVEQQKRVEALETGVKSLVGAAERLAVMEPKLSALQGEVQAMPSPTALQTSQKFLTEVFSSYRWLENCDPESITCRTPLGHHTALRARSIYKDTFYLAIDYVMSNQISGPVLEFGSRSGFTSRCLAEVMAERNYPDKLYLYDSFEGLPQITSAIDLASPEVKDQKVWFEGSMAMPEDTVDLIRNDFHRFMQPGQFEIVKGYFSETLPQALPDRPVALAHIDCDLYQSTMEVFEAMKARNLFQNGMVLMFDDYNTSKADPNLGERRALADFLTNNSDLSISPFLAYNWHGQAFFLHVSGAKTGVSSRSGAAE